MRKSIADINLFFKSFSLFGNLRKKYVFATILASCELALLFVSPKINQTLIHIVTGESKEPIFVTLIWIFFLFLLLVPLIVGGKYLQAITVAKGTAELKKSMFRKILSLPHSTMTTYKTGDFLTRLTNDATLALKIFDFQDSIHLVRFLVVFPITLVLLLIYDWRIALAGMIYGTINLILSLYLNPYAKKLEGEAKVEVVNSASFLMEALRGIPIIRVFTLQQVLAEKYRRISNIIRIKRIKFRTAIGITYGAIDFFAQSAQAVGFTLGILMAGNQVPLGNAVFNATLMGMMADSIFRLSTFQLKIQPHLIAINRTFELLALPSEELLPKYQKIDTSKEDAVCFKNICFSYGNKKILDNLSLTLKKGEQLAIVGGSGEGKSTLIKLMENFYEPQSGEITYFGINRKEMSAADIRRIFSYVPQECTLFDGSIQYNIIMGNPKATQNEIEYSAHLAGIHDFIQSLPQKYNTAVGECGNQLSGGQRQRIVLARAILKNAPILLLDEATAALDSETEKGIQSSLKAIFHKKTTVTIAHRLSTIQNADRILVLEDGKIVEEGSFSALIQKSGRFKTLCESQTREAQVRDHS